MLLQYLVVPALAAGPLFGASAQNTPQRPPQAQQQQFPAPAQPNAPLEQDKGMYGMGCLYAETHVLDWFPGSGLHDQ
jgi:hypothetical protein